MSTTRPDRGEPNVLWALTGLDGRINREVYWLGNIMAGFVAVVFMSPAVDPQTGTIQFGPLSPFVFIALFWIQVALAVKRLHDRGLTGWFAAAFAVPFVGFVAFLVIGLLPGDRGANAYGPQSNARGPA